MLFIDNFLEQRNWERIKKLRNVHVLLLPTSTKSHIQKMYMGIVDIDYVKIPMTILYMTEVKSRYKCRMLLHGFENVEAHKHRISTWIYSIRLIEPKRNGSLTLYLSLETTSKIVLVTERKKLGCKERWWWRRNIVCHEKWWKGEWAVCIIDSIESNYYLYG